MKRSRNILTSVIVCFADKSKIEPNGNEKTIPQVNIMRD